MSRISSLIAQEGLAATTNSRCGASASRFPPATCSRRRSSAVRKWPVDVEVTLKVTADSVDPRHRHQRGGGGTRLAPGARRWRWSNPPSSPSTRSTPDSWSAAILRGRGAAAHRRRAQQRSAARHRCRQNYDGGDRAPDRRGSRTQAAREAIASFNATDVILAVD